MDYKYIEQLLERYWDCQTTLDEEEILRAFFNQEDIPARLLKYRSLFAYEHASVNNDVLGDDFDEKILDKVGEPMRPHHITIMHRLMPLFRAAAVVCFIITLGGIINNSLTYRAQNTKKVAVTEVKDTVKAVETPLAYDALAEDSANIVKN
ncbi:MAG: pyruvate ferredoxin oxidoreductase [Prevotellaceae bacterium]|nr:pyruvate ferredoxin oxidoreductase [Prevotellaceae bacterium]